MVSLHHNLWNILHNLTNLRVKKSTMGVDFENFMIKKMEKEITKSHAGYFENLLHKLPKQQEAPMPL